MDSYKAICQPENEGNPPLFEEFITVEISDESLADEQVRIQAEIEVAALILEGHRTNLLNARSIDFHPVSPDGPIRNFSLFEF
jgi:hypothetical protein